MTTTTLELLRKKFEDECKKHYQSVDVSKVKALERREIRLVLQKLGYFTDPAAVAEMEKRRKARLLRGTRAAVIAKVRKFVPLFARLGVRVGNREERRGSAPPPFFLSRGNDEMIPRSVHLPFPLSLTVFLPRLLQTRREKDRERMRGSGTVASTTSGGDSSMTSVSDAPAAPGKGLSRLEQETALLEKVWPLMDPSDSGYVTFSELLVFLTKVNKQNAIFRDAYLSSDSSSRP